jgi:hypothetical protein
MIYVPDSHINITQSFIYVLGLHDISAFLSLARCSADKLTQVAVTKESTKLKSDLVYSFLNPDKDGYKVLQSLVQLTNNAVLYIHCCKLILALAVLQSCCAVCIQFFILNQNVSLGKEASWNNASSPLLKLFQYESHCLKLVIIYSFD